MAKETIDVTLPGRKVKHGTRHIVTQIMEEIEDIFVGMGYQIVEGYEVESDHYNFERMNLPKIIQQGTCKILSIFRTRY